MSVEIPSPVAGFIDVVNAHDREGFLSAFTAEGFVDDWGRVFRGRDAIDGWSAGEFIGAQGTLTPLSVTTLAGGDIQVIGDWRSTHANGKSEFTFVVDGDRIASMTIREG